MKNLLIFIFPLFFQSVDYRAVFSDDYKRAYEFISRNSDLIIEYSDSLNNDPEIIIPVLFPEAIRYSIISNFLETKSLELAYVYSGSADFSIGYFQMKPSFIENLEKTIIRHPGILSKYDSLIFSDNFSLQDIRRKRIERLKSLEYQIVYANCMFEVLKIMYPEVFTYDKAYQIKFISTAFNHGFLAGRKEILEYTTKAFFPFNGKNKTEKYVYNEISLYFYHHDLPRIISKNQ